MNRIEINNKENTKILESGKFYGNIVATKYFRKLNKLKKGDIILQNYKDSIKTSAKTGMPYNLTIDKSIFKNKDYISIKKQMDEKFIALVCLAENMGYRVKNKKNGPFYTEDCVGIILYIEGNKDKEEIKKMNVIEFNKLQDRIMKRHVINKN